MYAPSHHLLDANIQRAIRPPCRTPHTASQRLSQPSQCCTSPLTDCTAGQLNRTLQLLHLWDVPSVTLTPKQRKCIIITPSDPVFLYQDYKLYLQIWTDGLLRSYTWTSRLPGLFIHLWFRRTLSNICHVYIENVLLSHRCHFVGWILCFISTTSPVSIVKDIVGLCVCSALQLTWLLYSDMCM